MIRLVIFILLKYLEILIVGKKRIKYNKLIFLLTPKEETNDK